MNEDADEKFLSAEPRHLQKRSKTDLAWGVSLVRLKAKYDFFLWILTLCMRFIHLSTSRAAHKRCMLGALELLA